MDASAGQRIWWQAVQVGRHAAAERCDVLFAPGGTLVTSFHPAVTMSRNMLLFDEAERRRYGISLRRAKLVLLRRVHCTALRRADGIIFLSGPVRSRILSDVGPLTGIDTIISHGVSRRFRTLPRTQRPIRDYSDAKPFPLLYVSTIDLYKHHPVVLSAVASLRNNGIPIELRICGPAYGPALRSLEQAIQATDPRRQFVKIENEASQKNLASLYRSADAFVFASSCEMMPNILLEAMAAGLPIACSDRDPMPSILQDGGLYFDPEDLTSTVKALRNLTADHDARSRLSEKAFLRAEDYTWEQCATRTYDFLARIAKSHGASRE